MARVVPTLTDATLDKPAYELDELMTLTFKENVGVNVQRTFAFSDLSGADWQVTADDKETVTATANAQGSGGQIVNITMTRTLVPGGPAYQDGAVSEPLMAAYTVAEVVDPPPAAGVLIGRSSSSWDHGSLTECALVRVYKFGSVVDSELDQSGATALFLSDEPSVQSASALDNALRSLFSRHPDVTVYYMPDNEITADQLSSSQAAQHNDKIRQMKAVTDDYPNAYMGINITAYGVRQGRHENLQPCAEYLDILIASCYAPGRMKSPPVWDPYENYLDQLLDACQEWGVPRFGCGEFGIPIDPRDANKRPTYTAGAVQYLAAGCESRGIEFTGFTYWDNQKSGGPDNRLQTDNPRTADALRNALN